MQARISKMEVRVNLHFLAAQAQNPTPYQAPRRVSQPCLEGIWGPDNPHPRMPHVFLNSSPSLSSFSQVSNEIASSIPCLVSPRMPE